MGLNTNKVLKISNKNLSLLFTPSLFYSADTKDLNSFDEFEEMWLKIGEELEKAASPPSPRRIVTVTQVAGKIDVDAISLEPTYSPANDGNWPPATAVHDETGQKTFLFVEDSILTSLR
jgi:hypothetical protein